MHFIDISLNRILHIFPLIILQHSNTVVSKKNPQRQGQPLLQSPHNQESVVPLVNTTPLSWEMHPRMHPWHKCSQQPNNIPSASLRGNTAWANKRDEHSKRRVRPRGEKRENRPMAFAQSFYLYLFSISLRHWLLVINETTKGLCPTAFPFCWCCYLEKADLQV